MRFLLTISFLIQVAFAVDIQSVARIKLYTGTATTLTVTDSREYGNFYKHVGTRKADGGVIVADGKGRLWERRYRLMDGIDAGWFGAIGDGKQDALPFLKLAAKYCIENREDLNLPDLKYRVTNTWVIGGISMSAEDSKLFEAYDQRAPTYRLQGVIDQNSLKPISIRGRAGTILWGDFYSDTLKAVMHYGLWGVNADHRAPAAEIKNITIATQKSFDSYGRLITVIPADRKLVGLLMQRCEGSVKVIGMQFHGLETGLLINSTYWTGINAAVFTNCATGLFTFASHSTTGTNLVGLHCGVAFHIKSGASVFNQLNTEECDQALIIGEGHNIFNALYFEKSPIDYDPNKYQVQIGYNDNSFPVRGTIINSMTLAVPGPNYSAGPGILLNKTAQEVSVNGSMFVSAGTKLTAEGNILNINNSYTDTPKGMPGKIFKDGVLISETNQNPQ